VRRNRDLVGTSSTIEFETDLGTFSFQEAISVKTEDAKFRDIQQLSTAKLREHISLCSLASDAEHIVGGRPPDPIELMRATYRAYMALSTQSSFITLRSTIIAIADGLESNGHVAPKKSDIIIHRFVFQVPNDNVRVFYVNCSSDGMILARKPLTWSLRDTSTRRKIDAEIVPALSDEEHTGNSSLGFVVFLKEDLSHNDEQTEYVFQFQYASRNSFDGIIGEQRSDYLAMTNKRSRTIPIADFILLAPNSFSNYLSVSVRDSRAGTGYLDSAPRILSGFLPGYAECGAVRFC